LKSFLGKEKSSGRIAEGNEDYAWTPFRREAAAFSDLAQLVEQLRLSLAVTIHKPHDQAEEAFEHVRKARPGLALLTP
jgi:hypothetical protein